MEALTLRDWLYLVGTFVSVLLSVGGGAYGLWRGLHKRLDNIVGAMQKQSVRSAEFRAFMKSEIAILNHRIDTIHTGPCGGEELRT